MFYSILWIPTKPHNYRNGMGHMQKLAQLTQDEHGLASRIYAGFGTGPANELGFLTPYENMATMVTTNEAIGASASFEEWANESREILDLGAIEWQTLRVLRAGGGNATANFLNTVSIYLTPGQMVSGRKMLNQFADHMESTYSRPVDVTSFEAGPHYRHVIGISYDDMAQYDAVQEALNSDEVYGQWSVDVLEMIDAKTIEKDIGRYL